MKKNIFIAGDSYCFYRDNSDEHWPAYLARKLELELQGEGYPGQGWWPTRKLLMQYQLSEQYNNTDLFVFCHTDHRRFLSDQHIDWNDFETIKKVYFTYLQSDAVSDWCVENWYRELNDIMANKTVIHLSCFKHPQFNLLQGKKMSQPLLYFSVEKAGGDIRIDTPKFGSQKVVDDMNRYHNHLSPDANVELAKKIAALL
jgi:hypothetical protein